MTQNHLQKIRDFFINALYLQIALTCVHIPLLVWWGLPFSLLTFVGNIAFSPFLSLFLGISSLLFLCELCGLPSTFLTSALEYLTYLWLALTKSAPTSVLLAFPKSSFLIMCTLPLLTLFVTAQASLKKLHKIAILSISLIVCWFVGFTTHACTTQAISVPCGKNYVTLANTLTGVVAVEARSATGRVDAYQWITYTLIPTLSTMYGSTQIETLFIPYATTSSLQRASVLCKHNLVKKIILPKEQKSSRYISESLNKLKKYAQEQGIMIEHAHAASMPFFHAVQ